MADGRREPGNKTNTTMETSTTRTTGGGTDLGTDLGTLADSARALLAATAEVVGDKVGEARRRLGEALEADLAGGGEGRGHAGRSGGESGGKTKHQDDMKTHGTTVGGAVDTFAEDARLMMEATMDAAEAKVGEARERLLAALESGRRICGRVRGRAIEGAEATGLAMHQHPYSVLAIGAGLGVGLGALVGLLAARRCSCTRN